MTLTNQIEQLLRKGLVPESLEVINESHHHAGHQPGFDGKGETHMRIKVVSEKFIGMSRLQRHRTVNEILRPILDAGLHALAVEAAAPDEPRNW